MQMNNGDLDVVEEPEEIGQYFGSRNPKQVHNFSNVHKKLEKNTDHPEESFDTTEKQKDYSKEYLEQYSRSVHLPSCRYLSVKFHPALKDHIIVLSEVNFEQNAEIDTLVDKPVNKNFTNRMRNKYIKYAKNKVARGDVINKAKTRFMDYSQPSLLSSESSSFFYQDSFYEGGEDGTQEEEKKNAKPGEISKRVKEFRGLKHQVNGVRGSYNKRTSSRPTKELFAGVDDRLDIEHIYRAMDLLIDENSKFFKREESGIQYK